MKALLLGARGAVGTVVRRELVAAGHDVTSSGRTAETDANIDLRGDLAPLADQAARHDVVVNASGIERTDVGTAIGSTPLVDISATGSYLQALREEAPSAAIVLGAGLVPGLSTILTAALDSQPDDDVDVLVMLGSG